MVLLKTRTAVLGLSQIIGGKTLAGK